MPGILIFSIKLFLSLIQLDINFMSNPCTTLVGRLNPPDTLIRTLNHQDPSALPI